MEDTTERPTEQRRFSRELKITAWTLMIAIVVVLCVALATGKESGGVATGSSDITVSEPLEGPISGVHTVSLSVRVGMGFPMDGYTEQEKKDYHALLGPPSVTIGSPSGVQQFDGGGTWTIDNMDSGDFMSISGQKSNETGTIVCKIVVDGMSISNNTSDAEYGIASCQGSVP